MTPEETKRYLMLTSAISCYDIETEGVNVVPTPLMRRILKRLILRGACINCALCGQQITNERDMSFDHIVPRSLGGSDYLHNMQPAHRKCNEQKGNNITPFDVETACALSFDSPEQILDRKKKRNANQQKKRNVVRIKPWNIDKFIKHR